MQTNRELAAGQIEFSNFDPRFIQITKREAYAILGFSSTTGDRQRQEDPRFPKPIHQGQSKNAPLRFVLAEVYDYSAQLIADFREKQEVA